MTSTVEYIRYRIAAEGHDAFLAGYRKAAESLAAAPQCIDYELSRCEEEPDRYILRIRWTSVQDHIDGFRKGEHFPAFFAAVKPFFNGIEEMQHYTVTDVVGIGKAAGEEQS
ncbi:putative quinol monooxygenase [Streptacidiphilus rugosus]|uniref:putative quinol monooxygenase n=1 Tax=Streptacidiphilus rugosus TaxID=405783 RepID=UPI00055F585C|nr:antibiotic biosynthesis monooxygenase family protein [Streptacidiphilus rugosus]